MEALKGVQSVIHCASVVDVSLFPDDSAMRRVNIEGKCLEYVATLENLLVQTTCT